MEHRFSERFQRRDDETKGAGKALGFFSAKGGCGATTVICHVAAALGLQKQKVLLMDLDLDAGMVGFITKTSQVHSILDAVTNLDIHGWKALVSKGMPGVEIMASPLALGVGAMSNLYRWYALGRVHPRLNSPFWRGFRAIDSAINGAQDAALWTNVFKVNVN